MQVDELNIVIGAQTNTAARDISQTARELEKLDSATNSTSTDMSALVAQMSRIADQMSQFVQSIACSSAGIAGLQVSADAVAASLHGVGANFDILNASMQTANGNFDAAALAVAGLSSASEASASALGGIASATEGFGDRMGALQTATAGTSVSMDDLRRGLSEVLGGMSGFSDSMSAAGADAESAAKKIAELSERLDRMPNAQNVMSLASGFKYLKSIVGTLGIGAFVKSSNDAYNVQMQNELKLTSHMKHRMNATEDQIQAIKDLASAQQKLGVIGDEIQLAGAQQLTTYARQTGTLKTLIPAMNNLIAQNAGYEASVGDATSAADMLGRALNGQFTSLKRMGVTFTEAQEQVLKFGTEEQKAAVLADAINSKVGNMNQLLANTPTGKLKQLQNDLGDFQEQLGATFQPLISSLVPIGANVMKAVAPVILSVSTGVSTIGAAIAKLDSPATRAIAFTVAAVVAVNKLKLALGGTAAGLILIGSLLTTVIGGMNSEENAIGDIVTNAFNGAAKATEGATDAAADYEETLGDVQKAASRLAGFDTITKLSGGGSSGSLVSSLLGSDWEDEISRAMDSTAGLNEVINSLGNANIKVDTSEALENIQRFASDADFVLKHFGDDEAMYKPLERMSSQIEKILNAYGLDGTAFIDFWKNMGNTVYNVLSGKDSEIFKGLRELDAEWTKYFSRWKANGIDVANTFSKSIYIMTNAKEIVESGKADYYVQDLLKSIPDGTIAGDIVKGFYDISGMHDKLADTGTEQYSVADFNKIIVDALKEGLSSEEALGKARAQYLDTDTALHWYNDLLNSNARVSAFEVETWRSNLINSGQIDATVGVSPQPTSRTAAYGRALGLPSNIPPQQIHVHVDVDGREIAQTVTDYQQEDSLVSGGMY